MYAALAAALAGTCTVEACVGGVATVAASGPAAPVVAIVVLCCVTVCVIARLRA